MAKNEVEGKAGEVAKSSEGGEAVKAKILTKSSG